MGRLKIDLALALFAIVFVNCVVQSQYYVEQPAHIYVVDGPDSSEVSQEQETVNANQFMSRKGTVSQEDESEDDDEESVEEKHQRTKGRPRPISLPSNFDEIVRRKLQLAKRQRRPLHGDPSPIVRHSNDDDEDDRKPESRLLWPFSIEISKSKDGWGPGHYGSYTSWASEGWGEKGGPSTGWGGYSQSHHEGGGGHEGGWGEDDDEHKKGLTDEEILKSKHYKKYQKKKKKIMKQLKKKLKFKRLIQKILQKHISYLDKIVPY